MRHLQRTMRRRRRKRMVAVIGRRGHQMVTGQVQREVSN